MADIWENRKYVPLGNRYRTGNQVPYRCLQTDLIKGVFSLTDRRGSGSSRAGSRRPGAAGNSAGRSTARARRSRRESPGGEAAAEPARHKRSRRDQLEMPKRKAGKKRARAASASSSEDEKAKSKKAKAGRSRRRVPSSSSSSSSSESSSLSDSSSSSGSVKGVKKGGEKAEEVTWTLLNDIWPLEERPQKLQDKRYVSQLSWQTLMGLQDRYEKEMEKKGVGAAIFGKDRKLSKVQFKKKADDCCEKLHPARWLRLPMTAPEKYWGKVPRAHEQRFRHLQLAHYGAESQINEKVILSLHDRQVRQIGA